MSVPDNCSFDSISKYFHLPLAEASGKLGICATILKKICRSYGIKRWPHRKIRSLDNMIQKYEDQIKNTDIEEEKKSIRLEIDVLREKRDLILKNPNTPIHTINQKKKVEIEVKEKSVDMNNRNVLEECYKIMKENYEKKYPENHHRSLERSKLQMHHLDINSSTNDHNSDIQHVQVIRNSAISHSSFQNPNPTLSNIKITGYKRKEFKPVVSIVVNSIPNPSAEPSSDTTIIFANDAPKGVSHSLVENETFKKPCFRNDITFSTLHTMSMETFRNQNVEVKTKQDELPHLYTLPDFAASFDHHLPSFSQFVSLISE